MTKCWDKAISVRPSMDEVVSQMSLLAQFFPGDSEPIKFLETGITFHMKHQIKFSSFLLNFGKEL